jgi:hypothetical protein
VAELCGGDTAGVPLLFDELAATSEAVAATSKRNDKVAAFTEVLRRLDANGPDNVGCRCRRSDHAVGGILGGGLSQGVLEGVLTTAVAKAAGVPVGSVRRAAMMAGDLGPVANAGLTGGVAALDAVQLDPVQPMLASTATSATEAIEAIGWASVEWKLDGARVQARRRGSNIKLFTRNLNDMTDRLAGIVETVRAIPGGDLVVDGEAMGQRAFFLRCCTSMASRSTTSRYWHVATFCTSLCQQRRACLRSSPPTSSRPSDSCRKRSASAMKATW